MQTYAGTQYVNVPVEIDEKTLTEIAGTTNGNYFRATSNSKLKEVYQEIDKLEKTKLKREGIQQTRRRISGIRLDCFLLHFA